MNELSGGLVPSKGVAFFIDEDDVYPHARFVETDELDFVNGVTAGGPTEDRKGVACEEGTFSRLFLFA